MPELSKSVVGKSKFIIRKWWIDIKRLLRCNTNLKFMFRTSICYDLPEVNATKERAIASYCTEIVIGFIQKCMSTIIGECNLFGRSLRIPCKFTVWFGIQVLNLVLNRTIIIQMRIIDTLVLFFFCFLWINIFRIYFTWSYRFAFNICMLIDIVLKIMVIHYICWTWISSFIGVHSYNWFCNKAPRLYWSMF